MTAGDGGLLAEVFRFDDPDAAGVVPVRTAITFLSSALRADLSDAFVETAAAELRVPLDSIVRTRPEDVH